MARLALLALLLLLPQLLHTASTQSLDDTRAVPVAAEALRAPGWEVVQQEELPHHQLGDSIMGGAASVTTAQPAAAQAPAEEAPAKKQPAEEPEGCSGTTCAAMHMATCFNALPACMQMHPLLMRLHAAAIPCAPSPAVPGARFHAARGELIKRMYTNTSRYTVVVGLRDTLPDDPAAAAPQPSHPLRHFVRRSRRGVSFTQLPPAAGMPGGGLSAGAFLELDDRPFLVAGFNAHNAAVLAASPATRPQVG